MAEQDTIEPVALRRLTLAGTEYAKGAKVPMTQAQYDHNLGPRGLGWVDISAPPAAAPRRIRKGRKPAK